MRLRVLSYNVHKFFNITNQRYILKELKERLVELNLDLVFLQEMRGLHPEKHKKDFKNDPLEHMADEIWSHYVYGKNAVYTSGNHGNAILSKYPFKSWHNHDISTNKFERRSLLVGTVEYENKDLTLACTHLDLTESGREKQQAQIISTLGFGSFQSGPLILGGDFNDWRGRAREGFCNVGLTDIFPNPHAAESFTFPSLMPVLPLDKMYFLNLRCVNAMVLRGPHWRKLSDHLPIIAEFVLD